MSDVVVTQADGVALIEMRRTERRNAVGGTLFADLLSAAEQADADAAIRALVTTGSGGSYCVGADVAELEHLATADTIDLGVIGVDGLGGQKGLGAQSPQQIAADHLGIGRWTERYRALGLPTVAAIDGAAAGGGLSLALLHDVRIASTSAKFATGWASLGLGPEMGASWLLPRLVGEARAFDLLTRTRPVAADEALAFGLVEAVVEPGDLLDAAQERARGLAALPAGAVRAAKRLVHAAAAATFGDQLEREWQTQRLLFASDETRARLQRALADLAVRRAGSK